MPKPTAPPLPPVRTFLDACLQAMVLFEDLGPSVHAAMCLGRNGQHRDLIAVTGPPHDLNTVVGYAIARRQFDPSTRKVLLMSTFDDGVEEIREDDVRRFQELRSELASAARPIELMDWLLVDVDNVRSIAITVHGQDAWAS